MEVTHSTFTLERSYTAPLEQVFGAWGDPEARRTWMAQGAEYSQDFVVDGHEIVRGTDDHGRALTHHARYVDIVTNERILTTSTLHSQDQLSTVSVTSVEFEATDTGTRVILTEHGMYLSGREQPGWREQGTAQQLDTLTDYLSTDRPKEK